MSTKAITNDQDVIDSREVIERLAELAAAWMDHANDPAAPALDDFEQAELETLTNLADQSDGIDDWQYGVALIRESYFQDYAQDLAEDIGALPRERSWPNYCIDWEWAARELRMDYTSVDFDGVEYLVR